MDLALTAPPRMHTTVELPLSKSLANRAALIAALCDGILAAPASGECDDTRAMRQALACRCGIVNVGPAGTAMRFLTAYFACHKGRTVVLDGSERMRERPIAPLVDALRRMGAKIHYLKREGYPPLHIESTRLSARGVLNVDATMSSQFVSALLMIAPVCGGMTLQLSGTPASKPYIDMTLAVMRHYGAEARWLDERTIEIGSKAYEPKPFTPEADWSAASYWYALAAQMPGSRVLLKGLLPDSLQSDSKIARFAASLGVTTEFTAAGALITSSPGFRNGLAQLTLDGTPDIAQTLVVAMCLKGWTFRFDGLHTLRIKETDRLAALAAEMAKLGFELETADATVGWRGVRTLPQTPPCIDTYDDHRMAMAMATAVPQFPGITIRNAQVAGKSYPDFWKHLREAGFTVNDVSLSTQQ